MALEGRYAVGKGMAFHLGALVAEDNLAAVETELDQGEVAFVLDDSHLLYRLRLRCSAVVKYSHFAVLEGAPAASRR